MKTSTYIKEVIKKIEINLTQRNFHYDKVTKENVTYLSIPFANEYGLNNEEENDIFDILFIPNEELKTITVLADKLLILPNSALEFKDFHIALNHLNVATLFGNLFHSPYSNNQFEIVFSNTGLIEELDKIDRFINTMIEYINFLTDEIYSLLHEFLDTPEVNEIEQ